MKLVLKIVLLNIALAAFMPAYSQNNSSKMDQDTSNNKFLSVYQKKTKEIEQLRIADSIKRVELETRLSAIKITEEAEKSDLQKQIQEINVIETNRIALKKAHIDSLRITAKAYPIIGILGDTLFNIYAKIGSVLPRERAKYINTRIRNLYDNDFLKVDSLIFIETEFTIDIVYGETLVMAISETDAIWNDMSRKELARIYISKIKKDIIFAKEETSWSVLLVKIVKIILVIAFISLIIWLIGKANRRLMNLIAKNKNKWLKNLSYKDYSILSADQELNVIVFLLKGLRLLIIIILLYLALPAVFSILVFTREWANVLFNLFWEPFKGILTSVWEYVPNLISIIVIYYVMKYFIRFVKYIFTEVQSEKLKISGFHADWAMPSYSIVRFLLYAFMFVMIFPYLPGSDSNIFKGVSVFIGIIFSFGSSSAVANIVAGLVITYMRPFKIGDRIKIGEITGDVVEKSLLVTRVKTVKNVEITIPNSTILTGNISNFSTLSKKEGLIINTTITIGYSVPWKEIHQALIDAALRVDNILREPKPFVLQSSLDDFYVSYQINAYTRDANEQVNIYSNLHQCIQDVCNERGIEIMSPHYRYQRDGNSTTIPSNYLPDDYRAPNFNIDIKNDKEN